MLHSRIFWKGQKFIWTISNKLPEWKDTAIRNQSSNQRWVRLLQLRRFATPNNRLSQQCTNSRYFYTYSYNFNALLSICDVISFPDVFDHKTEGIFCLLEDECKKANSSSTNFIKCVAEICSRKPTITLSKINALDFTIHHHTKPVSYSSVKKCIVEF